MKNLDDTISKAIWASFFVGFVCGGIAFYFLGKL